MDVGANTKISGALQESILTSRPHLPSIFEIEEKDKIASFIAEGLEKGVFTKSRYPVIETVRSLDKPVEGLFELYADSADALATKDRNESINYQNMHQVVEELDSNPDPIELSFRHKKPFGRNGSNYNIIHADKGVGQTRETFPRLLGQTETGESSKRSIDFLHGRMNRGRLLSLASTSYKLVATASDENPRQWTWTLIFRDGDEMYTLRDENGEFLQFHGNLSITGHSDRTHGCVIKLFDYGMSNPKDATDNRFQRRLMKNLPFPPYPLYVKDMRYDTEMLYSGVDTVVDGSDFVQTKVESEFNIPDLGDAELLAYVREPDFEGDKKGILFGSSNDNRMMISMCGQSHFKQTVSVVSSNINHNNIAEDIVIFLRLENVRQINNGRKAVFGENREEFVEEDVKESVLNEVYREINENEELQEVNTEENYRTTDPDEVNPSFPEKLVDGEETSIPLGKDIPEDSSIEIESINDSVKIETIETEESRLKIRGKITDGSECVEDAGFYYSIDGERCGRILEITVENSSNNSDKNYRVSVSDSDVDLNLPDEPEDDTKNFVNPREIGSIIEKSGISETSGSIFFSIGDIKYRVNNKDCVGEIIEGLVGEILDRQNIAYAERDNAQLPPDYALFDENGDSYPLEIKAFDTERNPNFDIGNFAAYSELVANNPDALDARYLIFEYSMEDGTVSIEDYWVKTVWEIVGESGDYPLRLQVKKDHPHNIRPVTWYSERSSYEPFGSKKKFVDSIYETMLQFPQFTDENARALRKKIYQRDEDLPDESNSQF